MRTEKPMLMDFFQSSTNPAVEYKTALYEHHEHCDCKGFQVRGTCKHVKDLLDLYQNILKLDKETGAAQQSLPSSR